MEAQVSLTVAFSSSDYIWGSCMVNLLASQAHQQCWSNDGHLTNFWCFWQCGQVPNPTVKLNQHL